MALTSRSIALPHGAVEVFEVGTGRPLLFLHGGLGDAPLHVERLAPLLAPRFRVIAPNLPRFGRSAPLAPASFDLLADWVVALLDALAVERVIAVGNSFGAGLARVLAARHPARVSHLVLLGGGLVPRVPWIVRAVLRTPLAWPLFWLMRVLSFSRRGLARAIADPAEITDALLARSRASAPAFVALMRDVALGPPASATQPGCPALAVWGDRDALFPLAQGRAIAADVKAELVVLPGVAHLPQREAPEETARRIEAFVG